MKPTATIQIHKDVDARHFLNSLNIQIIHELTFADNLFEIELSEEKCQEILDVYHPHTVLHCEIVKLERIGPRS